MRWDLVGCVACDPCFTHRPCWIRGLEVISAKAEQEVVLGAAGMWLLQGGKALGVTHPSESGSNQIKRSNRPGLSLFLPALLEDGGGTFLSVPFSALCISVTLTTPVPPAGRGSPCCCSLLSDPVPVSPYERSSRRP